ncbi:DUF4233 domain-containing protein [Humidisolicoccus flavus]|uniref:DUF4233 domain-containing protein n=1 Tax=Humidisolicoccus flavus TaxID=3111414 RepID=UPI00324AC7C3
MNARPRKQRGLLESLLRIVHVLEICMLFFAGLALWGVTRDFTPVIAVVAIVLALVIMMQFLGTNWGWIVSALLQVAIVALGIFEPLMIVVGLIFAGIWLFCFIKANQIYREQMGK